MTMTGNRTVERNCTHLAYAEEHPDDDDGYGVVRRQVTRQGDEEGHDGGTGKGAPEHPPRPQHLRQAPT